MTSENVFDTLDEIIQEYHRGIGIFMTGDCEPAARVLSAREDVSLGNPFGPFVRGLPLVVAAMRRAAAHFRDGKAIGFDRISEYTTPELAYIIELERLESKIGGRSQISPIRLRATSIFRHEGAGWKLTHRHVDSTATADPVDSVLDSLIVGGRTPISS